MKRQATDWDKILQTTNLTKDLYLEIKQVSKLNSGLTCSSLGRVADYPVPGKMGSHPVFRMDDRLQDGVSPAFFTLAPTVGAPGSRSSLGPLFPAAWSQTSLLESPQCRPFSQRCPGQVPCPAWSTPLLLLNCPATYEVTSTKYTRDIYKELLISLVASLFMCFRVLFLLLWVGIYIWAPKGSNQAASLNPCFCKLIFLILLLLEVSYLLLTIKAAMTAKKKKKKNNTTVKRQTMEPKFGFNAVLQEHEEE